MERTILERTCITSQHGRNLDYNKRHLIFLFNMLPVTIKPQDQEKPYISIPDINVHFESIITIKEWPARPETPDAKTLAKLVTTVGGLAFIAVLVHRFW